MTVRITNGLNEKVSVAYMAAKPAGELLAGKAGLGLVSMDWLHAHPRGFLERAGVPLRCIVLKVGP
jgi:hypothetical protein